MQCCAVADDCALVGLRRDDGPDADDALLSRSIGQQRHRHICFDVVDADVARGCAALFEVVPYILGVAFSDVEGYGDRFLAVYGRVVAAAACAVNCPLSTCSTMRLRLESMFGYLGGLSLPSMGGSCSSPISKPGSAAGSGVGVSADWACKFMLPLFSDS